MDFIKYKYVSNVAWDIIVISTHCLPEIQSLLYLVALPEVDLGDCFQS
jgi:hypothetical protein